MTAFLAFGLLLLHSGLTNSAAIPSVLAQNNGGNQTTASLQSVDEHLEECINELHGGNTEGALTHCQLADDQLDTFL